MAAEKKYKTAAELQTKIDAYFIACDAAEKPYTITGLALALGFSTRQSLLNYENDKDLNMVDAVKKAKLRCQCYVEEFLFSGKNPAGPIFNLKNNYGWIDKQEVQHSGQVDYDVSLPADLRAAHGQERAGKPAEK